MKNKHKSLIWLLLFLKLIVSLQKISCISAKKSSKLDVLRSFSIIFAKEK